MKLTLLLRPDQPGSYDYRPFDGSGLVRRTASFEGRGLVPEIRLQHPKLKIENI